MSKAINDQTLLKNRQDDEVIYELFLQSIVYLLMSKCQKTKHRRANVRGFSVYSVLIKSINLLSAVFSETFADISLTHYLTYPPTHYLTAILKNKINKLLCRHTDPLASILTYCNEIAL